MSLCQCEACARQQGVEPGLNFTQAHRLRCEAMTVLSWPLEERREYLDLVERRRGASGRALLEAALREEFALRRA